MKLYAIADLHMPGGADKSMDIFGANWEGHVDKIFDDWRSRVTEEDAVLILLSNEEKLLKKLVRLSSDYRMEQVIDFRKRSKIFILRRK